MKNRAIFLLALTAIFFSSCTNQNYDILIVNGMIYNGEGNEPFHADVAIKDSIIIAIGDDAKGLAVSPGFIDMHAHLDPILKLSDCESHIRQGVTTALGGPDGGGPWPIKTHLDTLQKIGIGMNVAYLVGHNRIRKNIMALEGEPMVYPQD